MTSRFFFRVRTQFDNLGDALINRELVGLLSGLGTVTLDLSRVPAQFLKSFTSPRVETAHRCEGARFWSALLRAGFASRFGGPQAWLILNPGGYIGEISWIATLRSVLLLGVFTGLRIAGVRIAGVGRSYERLGSRRAAVTRLQAQLMTVHVVRDSGSLETCRALGIRATGPMPDLAFALPTLERPAERAEVVLSFRVVATGAKAQAEALASALTGGRKVRASWQVERDRPEMEAIALALSESGVGVETEARISDIEANRVLYGAAEAVVSNRLHVLLLAMSAGGLPIALIRPGEQLKIAGLYRDIGLCELLVTPEALAGLLDAPDEMERLRRLCVERFRTQNAMLHQHITQWLGEGA